MLLEITDALYAHIITQNVLKNQDRKKCYKYIYIVSRQVYNMDFTYRCQINLDTLLSRVRGSASRYLVVMEVKSPHTS